MLHHSPDRLKLRVMTSPRWSPGPETSAFLQFLPPSIVIQESSRNQICQPNGTVVFLKSSTLTPCAVRQFARF